ncbi:MAG: DUF5420 family protein [Pseudomonadota bacterium]|nr:DUF5420 family protein [Pseudomonadota bacterium]
MNEKRYFYFVSTPDAAKAILSNFNANIAPKRDEIVNSLYIEAGGAVAHTETSNWGGASSIGYLVYPVAHPIVSASHVKVHDTREHNGEKVAVIGGKGNHKLGKALNALVTKANDALADFPRFSDWFISSNNLMRTMIGDRMPNSSASSMISTNFGIAKDDNGEDVAVLRVPKYTERTGDKPPVDEPVDVPEGFREITYGQFFDLVN